MPKGNPNPSPKTRFGAPNGNANNLGGKTRKQRQAEYEAAEMSARLRHKMLSVMLERVEAGEIDPLSLVEANSLRLFKDSEDRAHGQPDQTVTAKVTGGADKVRSYLDNIAKRGGEAGEASST